MSNIIHQSLQDLYFDAKTADLNNLEVLQNYIEWLENVIIEISRESGIAEDRRNLRRAYEEQCFVEEGFNE